MQCQFGQKPVTFDQQGVFGGQGNGSQWHLVQKVHKKCYHSGIQFVVDEPELKQCQDSCQTSG